MCKDIARPGYEWITEKYYTHDAFKHRSCNHELNKGEVWLGNTCGDHQLTKGVQIPFYLKRLKTIRLGNQAYCICGLPISKHHYLPLIIHESELEEYYKIVKKHFKNQ